METGALLPAPRGRHGGGDAARSPAEAATSARDLPGGPRRGYPGRRWAVRQRPEAWRIAESFPSIAATVDAFATAGFAPEALESVPQVTADSMRAWCERVRLRADSTLQPLDDDVFARRLAEAERAAAEERVARPVVDRLDLLVLRPGHRL